MSCLLISTVIGRSYAEETIKKDEIPIAVIEKVSHGTTDKSGCILPSINGNVLTVVFTENIGQVTVDVTTASGLPIECTSAITPNGIQYYIPLAGDYIVTFTLANGDVYYGEFTVTD